MSLEPEVICYNDMIANEKVIALCLCAYWWSVWPHILKAIIWGYWCFETVYWKKDNIGAGCLDDTVQLHQKSNKNARAPSMLQTAKYSSNWIKRELVPQQVLCNIWYYFLSWALLENWQQGQVVHTSQHRAVRTEQQAIW